jgi:hypothetical protein
MGVLQRFERRIEEMVNRPFARAFKAEVQPVEVASALQRECDDRAAIVSRGRTMVPNQFDVELGPHDHDRLSVYEEPLAGELAAMVEEHAKEQHYSFIGPVRVAFERHEDLETGRFRVRSSAVAGARDRRPAPEPGTTGERRAASPGWLEVGSTRYELSDRVTRIGRGGEADLRLDDPGVSRNHAEVRVSGDRVSIRDLGSTNGILLDGQRVGETDLEDGTAVVLGSTTLVFHRGPRR